MLFLSNMPAILLEAGFLTHRGESRRLSDPGYLGALAERIAEGLEHYRGDGERVAARPTP